jgi:hypothetical protein
MNTIYFTRYASDVQVGYPTMVADSCERLSTTLPVRTVSKDKTMFTSEGGTTYVLRVTPDA